MKKKKVAIYIRVSTDQQNTDLQIKDLTEYTQRRDFEVYKIYEVNYQVPLKQGPSSTICSRMPRKSGLM